MFGDRHLIVVDLGFGDAGKGATVDWLCSPDAALEVAAVVRFNGGAQAAHNVVAHGRHHTFQQFGSGTFSGVATLLSRHMLVEPLALAAEATALAKLGVADPLSLLYVDERALLTTPIHGAANRCREDMRGAARHGSCGIGIGETAAYALTHDAPRVADCRRPDVLRRKLIALREHYGALLAAGTHRFDPIDDLVEVYREFARAVAILPGDQLAAFAAAGRLVFEGAQGVLLDEWRGLHPYTTWSTVEPRNARAMLARIDAPGYVLGVTRAYQTRHGAGPFPSEDAELTIAEPHNGTGRYQGAFRRGHLDPVLLRYGVRACAGIDGLAVNHLDAVGDIRTVSGYVTADGYIDRLDCGPWQDLDYQQRLTDTLTGAVPVFADLPEDVPGYLERELGAPVVLTADGPDRSDRTVRVTAAALWIAVEQQSAVSLDVVALRFGRDDPTVTVGVAPRQWEPFAGELALPGVLLHRGERLAAAARRAVHTKLGVPERSISAVGQLVTFDEPNRDPRGPTLSIAMWAVVADHDHTDTTWTPFDEVPPLAFDHNRIVDTARDLFVGMLWKDLTFTRALIGEEFPATRAVELSTALEGTRPDPGNLNRTLAALPGLTRTGERMRVKATGRPAAVWAFDQSA